MLLNWNFRNFNSLQVVAFESDSCEHWTDLPQQYQTHLKLPVLYVDPQGIALIEPSNYIIGFDSPFHMPEAEQQGQRAQPFADQMFR